MSSTITSDPAAFGRALMASIERRQQEERDRYAVNPGERRRVLGEMSPCSFLGHSLKVTRVLGSGHPELHGVSIGGLRVTLEAYYGQLGWALEYWKGGMHFTIAGSRSYESGGVTPLECMEQAEAALAEFKALVAELGSR